MKAFSDTPIPLSAYIDIKNKGEFELKMENMDQVSVNFLLFASGITGRSLCSGSTLNTDDGWFICLIYQTFITSVKILTERTVTVIRPNKRNGNL